MAAAPADANALQGMAITTTTVFHPNTSVAAMSQNEQSTMQIPIDVLSNLLTSIDSLRQEVRLLRHDVGAIRNDAPDFLKARQETSLLRTQVRFDMKAIITSSNDVKKQLQIDMNRVVRGHTELLKGHRDLKNEIRHLNENVRDLERHSGVAKGFTCFDQLLPELRIHIWHFALSEPELFALERAFSRLGPGEDVFYHKDYSPKWPTRKSSIMWVNQEARKEAKRVLADFESKAFWNYETDTLWLVQLDQMDDMYLDLAWDTLHGQARRLAIHYGFWNNDIENIQHLSNYDELVELVLIVGEEKGLGKPVMAQPRNAPSHYTNQFPQLEGASWSAMSEKVVMQIKEVAKQRRLYREHLIQDHGDDEEDLDVESDTWTLWDKVPAVRFVELVSDSTT